MAQDFDVTGESKSQSLGVDLKAEAKGSPGHIDISGTVAGKLGLSVGGAVSGGHRPTININYRLAVPNDVQSTLRSHVNQLSGTTSLPKALIPSTSSYIPTELQNIRRDQAQLWTGVFGNHLFGSTPISFDRSVSFTPVKVPYIGSKPVDLSSLPDMTVIVNVTPTGFIQRLGAGALNDLPEVRLSVPASAFIENVNIQNTPCTQMFSDVFNQIQSIASGSSTVKSQVESDLSTYNSAIQTIAGATGASPSSTTVSSSDTSQQISNKLDNLRNSVNSNNVDLTKPSTWVSGGSTLDNLKQAKSNVQKTDPSTFKSKLQSQISTLDGIKTDAQSGKYGNCAQQITSKANDAINTLNQVLDLVNKALEVRRNILDILPSSLPSKTQQLSCADVSNVLKNQVSGFEQTVKSFTSKPVYARTPSRYSSILHEGQNLRSKVQSQVNDNNPCKQQLNSTLESALNSLKQVGSASQGQLPCGRQYPNIDNTISNFEQDVVNFKNNPSAVNAQKLIQRGNNIMDQIKSNTKAGGNCRNEFTSRVQSSISSINMGSRGVRINLKNIGKGRGTSGNIQKQLQSLRQRLNNLNKQG